MTANNLPESHNSIIYATRLAPDGQKLLATPLTRAEVLADTEIKQWLDRGYVLEDFTNLVSANDPYATVVTVHLRRPTE